MEINEQNTPSPPPRSRSNPSQLGVFGAPSRTGGHFVVLEGRGPVVRERGLTAWRKALVKKGLQLGEAFGCLGGVPNDDSKYSAVPDELTWSARQSRPDSVRLFLSWSAAVPSRYVTKDRPGSAVGCQKNLEGRGRAPDGIPSVAKRSCFSPKSLPSRDRGEWAYTILSWVRAWAGVEITTFSVEPDPKAVKVRSRRLRPSGSMVPEWRNRIGRQNGSHGWALVRLDS